MLEEDTLDFLVLREPAGKIRICSFVVELEV